MNATTKTETVTVKCLHRASRPNTVWVNPQGWQPDTARFGAEAIFENGGVWGSEEEGEVAGMAATFADLDDNDPEEDMLYEVQVSDLFWLSSGDCRNIGTVEIAH